MTSPQATTTRLTLVSPLQALPVESAPSHRERREERRHVSHPGALRRRLTLMGSLAPQAPLSFVMVKLYGLDSLSEDARESALSAISNRVLTLTRATDAVGRYASDRLGIVLQGTGASAASAVAARLQFHLDQLAETLPSVSVVVSVATGHGFNANALPVAAMDSLLDAG